MVEKTILVINGYGSALRKKSRRLVITNDGETFEYPVESVEQILITGACSLSSGAISFAADEELDIVICSPDGTPSCRLVPCHGGGIATARRNQVRIANEPEGFHMISRMVSAKITHMGTLLRSLAIRRDYPEMVTDGENILKIKAQLPYEGLLPRDADKIRGLEGEASHRYFSALSKVISSPLYLGQRSQRPALDPFNAYLNYGYGILYNEIEKDCLLAGIDPYAGFLHADRYGHKSMVYDLIEPFRQPVIDRVVISLALSDRMSGEDLNEQGFLTNDARRSIITAVISRLDKEIMVGKKKITFREAVRDSISSFALALKENKPFSPFEWSWR